MTRTVEILLADWGVNIGVEIEIEKENVCENEMKGCKRKMEIGKTWISSMYLL